MAHYHCSCKILSALFIVPPLFFFFLRLGFFFNTLFIYLWLYWVFVSVRGLSLVAASGGRSSSRRTGLSLSRPLLLRSTGSRRTGSVVVAHGPSCSAACGILPDQGPNPCPLHWQADSQPLRHQGSPTVPLFISPLLPLIPHPTTLMGLTGTSFVPPFISTKSISLRAESLILCTYKMSIILWACILTWGNGFILYLIFLTFHIWNYVLKIQSC